ncbi:MAG: vWA domain-containing protein [Planctomycetota bacterium]
MSVVFGWPEAWGFALFGPMLAVVLSRRLAGRRRALALREEIGPRLPWLVAEVSPGRRLVREWAFAIAGALGGLALMQPHLGMDRRDAMQRGVDVLVCLDVSRSMLARDVGPSRLERAQDEIRALASRVRGDRLALVVFAGEARLLVPWTHDRESLVELAGLADPWTVERGGSDLGAALELAGQVAASDVPGATSIVVLTDGEDLAGRGRSVAAELGAAGVTVHAVGIGTRRGSKITVDDGARGEAFLRDAAGEDVISALDPTSLRAMAEAAGGAYVDVSMSPRPLVEVYETEVLGGGRSRTLSIGPRDGAANRYQFPLALGVLLLVVRIGLGGRRR